MLERKALGHTARGVGIGIIAALIVVSGASTACAVLGDEPPTDAGELGEPPPLAPPAAFCASDAGEGPLQATWTIDVNGELRQFDIYVPASVSRQSPAPLLFNFHGLVMNGGWQAEISRAQAKADAEGFIAIHAEGTGVPRGWNAGACCGPANLSGVDDVAFVDAMIAAVGDAYCIDAARIYATGFSNGGFLAHRLACERADVFAAVAAVAGVLGIEACAPSRPIPVMHIHGTRDVIVPYDSLLSSFASVPATMARWRDLNECAATTTPTYENGDATCTAADACAAGADVVHCVIDGGGHQWPGGDAIFGGGHLSRDLDATAAIWTFFAAHPMP